MAQLGYDPSDMSTDVTTPSGIGNVASAALLDYRHHDGSNQLGDEPGGIPGVPYSDYTGYQAINDPMDVRNPRNPLDPSTVHDPSRWPQLRYIDPGGHDVTPAFVGAQWFKVTPFAMSSPSQFRSNTPPAKYGSTLYARQAAELLDISASLDDEQKMIAEYWADGPKSEPPPGHWDLMAQFVATRDHHGAMERGVDLDVQMFFALTNAIHDAAICAWDNKRAYDYVRPITALRYLYYGQRVRAWAGPYQGTQSIPGETWFPYQPATFPTPPFPEYCSGHSTFSGRDPEAVYPVRPVRLLGDIPGGELPHRAGGRAGGGPHPLLPKLLRSRGPGRHVPALRRHPLRAGRRGREGPGSPGRRPGLGQGPGLHQRAGLTDHA